MANLNINFGIGIVIAIVAISGCRLSKFLLKKATTWQSKNIFGQQ